MNDGQPLARPRGHLLGQPLDVVARDGDRHRRRLDLLSQQVIVHEDVVGVTGEAERFADETRQRQRRRRRVAGPVGVDDVGIELPHPVELLHGAGHGLQRLRQLERAPGERAAERERQRRQRARMREERGSASPRRRPGRQRISHARQEPLGLRVHQLFGRRLQRKDPDVGAGGDQRGDLTHDEGLRPAGKQRDDVEKPRGAQGQCSTDVPVKRARVRSYLSSPSARLASASTA